jgi:tetratricopeptide (TPR) repeat protein
MESVAELQTIKWLLVGLLACFVVIALVLIATAFIIYHALKITLENQSGTVYKKMAEDFLTRNEISKLVELNEERLLSHPHDVWAHWYMAQAKYYEGLYPESKRYFARVLELEPSWYTSVDSWVERIAENLDKGPKIVQ